jgi:hypothetical protein
VHEDKNSSRAEWPLLGRVLPPLLRSLTSLRKLELHGMEWTSLTAEVRKSLRDILARPSLIHFETVDTYFSRLTHFTSLIHPHLKQLTMCFNWGHEDARTRACRVVDGEIEQEAIAERQPCRLEYLKFPLWFRNSDFIDWLLGSQSAMDISNLRALDTWFDDKNSLMRLLRKLGSSLEHLTIRDIDMYDWGVLNFPASSPPENSISLTLLPTDGTLEDSIDLGHQQNLQTLFLMARFHHGTASYLTCMLSQLVAPKLQEISFSFWFPTNNCARGETAWSDLAEIDLMLGSPAFDSLRSVRISFRPRSSFEPIHPAIEFTSPTTTATELVPSAIESVLSSPKWVHAGNVDKIRQKFVNHFPMLIAKGILQVRGGDNVILV